MTSKLPFFNLSSQLLITYIEVLECFTQAAIVLLLRVETHTVVEVMLSFSQVVCWYLSGCSNKIGSEGWGMERCIYADGWRTLEAAHEQGILVICRN